MAKTISFTIENNLEAQAMMDAYADTNGYQVESYDSIADVYVPNPQTKAQFFRQSILNHMRTPLKEKRLAEKKAEIETAIQAQLDAIEAKKQADLQVALQAVEDIVIT